MTQTSALSRRLALLAFLDSQNTMPTVARLFILSAVVVTKWSLRSRTRATLGRLDPHELRDIGVTPSQARTEADRPFWEG